MTVVHVHTKDAPLRDPLGVRRGVTGLRAEIREALVAAAYRHDCADAVLCLDEDCSLDEAALVSGQIIEVDHDQDMTELLDRLVAIAERGERT